jgi:hypothetical protein
MFPASTEYIAPAGWRIWRDAPDRISGAAQFSGLLII